MIPTAGVFDLQRSGHSGDLAQRNDLSQMLNVDLTLMPVLLYFLRIIKNSVSILVGFFDSCEFLY